MVPVTKPSAAPSRRKDGLLTTGDMARLSRNTLRTVRFYEEAGLVVPAHRTEGGHRLFQTGELQKLRLITDLRAAGFSLEEIRSLLAIKARGSCAAVAARELTGRLRDQIHEMTERAELLTRLATELRAATGVLDHCSDCPRTELFPDHCGACQVMDRPEGVPTAVTVLWGVSR